MLRRMLLQGIEVGSSTDQGNIGEVDLVDSMKVLGVY